jgi:formamidopyrimidine-DNA glycosylase
VPELPEVHTVMGDLKKTIVGAQITGVWIQKEYKKIPDHTELIKKLIKTTVINVERVAKNIVICLDNNSFLLIHLAMTGRIFISNNEDKNVKWQKFVLKLETATDKHYMYFSDVRMFGKVALLDGTSLNLLKNKYGPEPIAEVDINIVWEKISKKKTNIKTVLLDQTIIAGLGNIYATDTLFLAKIHPETLAHKLSRDDFDNIIKAAKLVLNEGIKHRGSTLKDRMYVDGFGNAGSHQDFFQIYDKKICPVCNNPVVYKKINGRGSFFCPNCQKLK